MKSGLSSRSREPSPGQLRITGYLDGVGVNLRGWLGRIIWRMSDEPRILVYEGRRFLRPETEPKMEGAKEAGFENFPRLAIASVGTTVFMIGSGVWFANKLRSGEIPWDGPMKWFVLMITLGPLFFFCGLVLIQGRKRPPQKPVLPPNPVLLLSSLAPNQGKTKIFGSLELKNGLIRVVGETQTVEINRLEVQNVKIVEGRVRLVIPKFHKLPVIHISLCPVNEELGNLAVKREGLKELVSRIAKMPTSTLPSTYPRIEFREFQRPPGTLAKCVVAGVISGLGLMSLAIAIGRPETADPTSTAMGFVLMPVCLATLFGTVAFGDVWVAKSNNKWLRKKGIIQD